VRPPTFPADMVDNNTLLLCLGMEWLAPTVDPVRARERLRVRAFTLADLVTCLAHPHGLRVAARPAAWLVDLYGYVGGYEDADALEAALPALQRARLLRLAESVDGACVSAHQCRRLRVLGAWPATLGSVSPVRISGGNMVSLDPATLPPPQHPGRHFLARYARSSLSVYRPVGALCPRTRWWMLADGALTRWHGSVCVCVYCMTRPALGQTGGARAHATAAV
jgi:hypothetical protein